jgi:aminoglycoside phosphotransferase (APT) family kinase protein
VTSLRTPIALTATELTAIAVVMRSAGVELAGELNADLIAGGRSNLTFRLTDHDRLWVLRTPPRAGRTPSAHDVAREYTVTMALGPTDVPVPPAVLLCTDESVLGGPFAIAGFVPGRTIQTRDDLDALGARAGATATMLMQTLAALHRVDYVAIGLGSFGRPDAYAQRQLMRWAAQWEIVGSEPLRPLAAEVIGRLGALIPPQTISCVVHGDFRIDNTILDIRAGDALRLAAVVDWELSTIGDPISDVAMACAYRHPAFDLIVGAPSAWTSSLLPQATQLAEQYEHAGGLRLDHWEFHLALAYFKIAVIAAGIDHRVRAGATSDPAFNTAGDSVRAYVELASDSLGGRV